MGKRTQPPAKVADIIEDLVTELTTALGTDLVSATLFGSSANPARYRAGRSDINLLLLLADTARNPLKKLLGFCQAWRAARVAPPLVMTPSYLATSLDVFPLELVIMAASHQTIAGPDPLADLAVKPGDLRLQLEREFKAKLMALSTRVLASDGGTQGLTRIVSEAAPAFNALFQGLLYLKTGGFPQAGDEVLAETAEAGFQVEAIRKLALVAAGGMRPTPGELLIILEEVAVELGQVSQALDQMPARP